MQIGRNEALTEHVLHWNKLKILKLPISLTYVCFTCSRSYMNENRLLDIYNLIIF